MKGQSLNFEFLAVYWCTASQNNFGSLFSGPAIAILLLSLFSLSFFFSASLSLFLCSLFLSALSFKIPKDFKFQIKLGEHQDAVQQEPEINKITELREAYRTVGQDLLKLLYFIEINAIGLRKILKKFDKRFGYRFTDYYVKTRANHPYSQLQQVFKHVGLGAVVGALSRNLHELHDRQGSYLSIYDQPSLPLQDPVVDSINAVVDRLSNSTNFLNFLAQHALIMQDELPAPTEEDVDDNRYHFMSLLLNLANTFLYMVNTYIIVPTADDYSTSLGAAPTICGIIIGAMAVAQLFSSVYFSAWSNRSYFRPLGNKR